MACGCGCSGVRTVSRLARRRASIGAAASAAAGVVQQFDLTQYVPADIQSDYATGKSYYDAFSQAAQGVSVVNGRIELSPAAQEAAAGAIAAGVAAAVPVLGAAYAALWALAPHAGPGPGTCASPPASAALSDLQAWPHFQSWAGFFTTYPVFGANTFEGFANPLLEYNWLLNANCYSDKSLPPAALLALLTASWNATHDGPARQVCRSGLNPPSWGLPSGYDPIANALESSLKISCPPGTPTNAFGPTVACGPFNVTACVAVNNGPIILKPLTLHFPHPATAAAAPTPTTAPASAAGTAATVAVVGLAAAAGFFFYKRPGALSKLGRRVR